MAAESHKPASTHSTPPHQHEGVAEALRELLNQPLSEDVVAALGALHPICTGCVIRQDTLDAIQHLLERYPASILTREQRGSLWGFVLLWLIGSLSEDSLRTNLASALPLTPSQVSHFVDALTHDPVLSTVAAICLEAHAPEGEEGAAPSPAPPPHEPPAPPSTPPNQPSPASPPPTAPAQHDPYREPIDPEDLNPSFG